jgi:glutamate racemase
VKIGLFDSGIGGLSVLCEARHLIRDAEWIFDADLDHVPYGLKSPDEIREYARDNTRFLIERGAGAVVVACNTATAVAIEDLRAEYDIPILGMEPAVKPAVEGSHDRRRIMVIATPVTIRENKLANLLQRVDTRHMVDLLAMPHLVTFAEKEEFDSPAVREYMEEEFASFDLSQYQALVLGCTHFNYFKPLYKEFFGDHIMLVDGNEGTVRHLAQVCHLPLAGMPDRNVRYTDADNMMDIGKTEYYISGKAITDKNMLNHLMRLQNRLEEVRSI